MNNNKEDKLYKCIECGCQVRYAKCLNILGGSIYVCYDCIDRFDRKFEEGLIVKLNNYKCWAEEDYNYDKDILNTYRKPINEEDNEG